MGVKPKRSRAIFSNPKPSKDQLNLEGSACNYTGTVVNLQAPEEIQSVLLVFCALFSNCLNCFIPILSIV